jgi:glucose dehydrogenase
MKRGGGTTWGWYSYDPELDLFYYGTGNPGRGIPISDRARTSTP